MLRFLVRRSLGAAVILLIISALTFFLFYSIPRDPALLACGKNCTPDALEVIRRNMGIDKPVPVQYWEYMVGIFAGRDYAVGPCPAPCLGYSFVDNTPVWDTILDRFPTTVSLALGGAAVFLTVGLGTGMLAAARRGTLVDKIVSSGSLVLSSLQIYFVGPLAIALFVYQLGWLSQPEYVNLTDDPAGWFAGLILPWCVLSIIFTANYTRMARSTMIEQLQEDHVRTARAKGMARHTVFFRYAWRGSLIPIITIFGVDMGSLFGGAMITEFTFTLPGLGRLAVESVVNTNLPMLMGVMLFAATAIILFNIVVDAAYALIDPRVRLS
ncbi:MULTISPECIES: ABC transporter permease [Streptomyces]|uniref:ABC transporter permease n=2 Tax=Streptomyces TaxID=1883 RepID=A0A3R7EVC6_9ACTN|nr:MULTISPECIES: ABC transporter permease [Streptomyces]KNE81717.1 ABC transporter permease [Streptomyces fradiae]OFA50686.1 ABC transporter permease [Streptomyces fradiae]PQM24125.1 ABC transporter permease [Streptomyces xinghaiensis]RKM97090.1 ABC transporter permease [Streptomyces xinghaiensis]RNC75516.1 ABC transporter permease [Streptomyces xinghaiensis]